MVGSRFSISIMRQVAPLHTTNATSCVQTSAPCLSAVMTPLSCTPRFVLTLQVRELQLQAMLASTSSSQHSTPAAGKAHPASRDASKPATDPNPCANRGNADSAAAVGTAGDMATGSSDSAVAAVGTVGSAPAGDTAELASLRAEVDRLQTERGVLAAKLGEAQQQLAEARKATDQKEGHLQGLQVSSCPLVYSAKPAPLW